MKVYPNVNIHTVTKRAQENSPKNAKHYWKPKEYWIPKYKENGAQFLHLAQHGGWFASMHPRQLRDCCRPVLYPLPVQK